MRRLIIPDVHHKIRMAQSILDLEKWDEVTWLGDFFDDFNDTPEIAERTAKWLDTIPGLKLLGNHDAPYLWPGVEQLDCPGYSREKRRAIWESMNVPKYRSEVRLFTQVDGYTLSHAGIHPSMKQYMHLEKWILEELVTLRCGHPFLACGRGRGGPDPLGGVTWLDWNREFRNVEGMPQIVGHSVGDGVRTDGFDNWCLDANLRYYAILEDGELEIKSLVNIARMAVSRPRKKTDINNAAR